jgi:hypothetical protein
MSLLQEDDAARPGAFPDFEAFKIVANRHLAREA